MLFGTSQTPEPPPQSVPPQGAEREPWSKWLDRTERESWQMELLISGFVLVLLVQAFEPIGRHLNSLRANVGNSKFVEVLLVGLTVVLLFGIIITVASLVLNVLLRGLWIGGVGLRSVSGGIDFEQLRVAPKFDRFLRGRLPDFDDYLLGLERVCSLIFSLAFLTLFSFAGLVVAALAVTLPVVAIGQQFATEGEMMFLLLGVVGLVVGVVLVVSAVDYVSGARLKRSAAFSRYYFPVYRLVGWLTLARFYRPLYYNLVDNRLGRVVVAAVVPYFAVVVTAVSFSGASLTPGTPRVGDFAFGAARDYGDSAANYYASPFLSELVSEGSFVQVYIPLGWNLGALAVERCDSLAQRYKASSHSTDHSTKARLAELNELITCLGSYWRLEVDGNTLPQPAYALVEYQTTELSCLTTIINIDTLASGPHYLSALRSNAAGSAYTEVVTIPFFKA